MKSLALGRIRAAAKKVESDGIQPSVGTDLSKLKDMFGDQNGTLKATPRPTRRFLHWLQSAGRCKSV
jgi:hypothetical protein